MIRKLKYIIPVVILIMTSCKKQLDINTDPNNPTTLPESKLLTGAEKSLASSLTADFGLTQILSTYVHQTVVRENPNEYGATGVDVENGWNFFFINTVTNLNVIITKGTADGNLQYVGIAEVLKAYGFSQMVDAYGDIPYSQTAQLLTGINAPVFEKGATIYPQLLTLLDKGIADMSSTSAANLLTPGTDDVIYAGAIASWIKAANTIKLKLLLQQRLITNVSTQVNALIAGGNLISQTSDSFMLPYGVNGATDDRNPGYAEYFASQRTYYTSPWFYGILKGYNPWIYTNITDPRIPYYFFNQIGPNDAAQNATDYRDGAFVSIYFGSIGPNQGSSQQNSMTVQGIYPVGGRYDDGNPQVVTATSGTGAVPYKCITYADVLYMQAELMQAGVITGNAKTTLQAAMTESFAQVDYIVSLSKTAQTVPHIVSNPAVATYINAVLAEYDAYPATTTIGNITLTKAQRQMASIMTQKWIASFGSSVDQYTDYRRTGFPILFDPNNAAMAPNHTVQPPINGDPANPGAQLAVPVELLRTYPLSLPWSIAELQTNKNAPAQKLPASYPVFWYVAGTVPVQ
jgi:hypothetical protein